MRHKADDIFEGCLVYHVKKHNVESVNRICHIDCLTGIALEVIFCLCRQMSSSSYRMCLQQFCWRETCSSLARWTSGRLLWDIMVHTSQNSYGHHEHFGIFWRRTYGSTSEACESRVTLGPLDLGCRDSRIQKVADTCWQ